MIKKTYIPGKPRNPKLSTATGTSGVGKTEFNQVAGSSHEHYNKGVLDQITEAMLVAALRDLITSTDTESELTDENMLSSLRVLSEIAKNNESFLEELKNQFLSKINPDTAQKLIKFVEGVEVGTFTTEPLGAGAAIKMENGVSRMEVDQLDVRMRATFRELIIESLKHIGGQLILSPARMKCTSVVDGGTYYRCYFDTGDGKVSNEFVAGDQARCQVFTGSGVKMYWRLVTSVGTDWINLSKTDAISGSSIPEAGDDIVQLGNATDTTRQSAIILSTVGIDAPSWKQYSGINSFSLEGKETTVFSKLGNKIEGKTVFTSGGTNLDDHLDGVAQDILDALKAAQDAEDKAQQAIEDAEANVATINTEVGKLQAQLDGEVSNWFYAYSPTLANYPASDWTTNEIKDRHVGDTFTNTEVFPAENAGKSWRFVKNGSTYSWTAIADSDAVKALLEASKAQATADGKSTTHLFQPTKYKLGDMWVLNADQTVNGTAYKQGDILTAIQDSETFNQAHWLKRVRYTDDTAIDNLEIGGRNLIVLSKSQHPKRLDNQGKIVPDEDSMLSNKIPIDTSNHDYLCISSIYSFNRVRCAFYKSNEELIDIYLSEVTSNIYVKALKIPKGTAYIYISSNLKTLNDIKLEYGNKPTDWTPAPEDVQAEIDDVSTGLTDLGTEINTAFSNLSITNIEANNLDLLRKSLAKEVADVRAIAVSMGVSVVDLDSKISALNTEVNKYTGKADSVYPITVTVANRTAIDTAFSNLEASIVALYEAIGDKRVDNIEIGGRNYLLGSNNLSTKLRGMDGSTILVSEEEEGIYNVKTEGGTTANKVVLNQGNNFQMGDNVTISFWINNRTNADMGIILRGVSLVPKTIPANYVGFFWHSVEKSVNHISSLLYFQTNSSGNKLDFDIGRVKLEKGNKATDWTPAPEDVEANIETAKTEAENAAKAYADTKSEAERVLAEAYADGIVTAEEQARIDDVNDKLAAAKAYAEAQDALLKAQQEAYADGAISTAEQAAIQAAKDYADLKKTEAQAYADGIVSDEEARAIADALDKYNAAKAHAEQLVKDIEIGGRNLLPLSDFGGWGSGYQLDGYKFTVTGKNSGIRLPNTHINSSGVQMVLSFKVRKLSGSVTHLGGHTGAMQSNIRTYMDGEHISNNFLFNYIDDTDEHHFVTTFTTGSRTDDWIYIQPNRSHYSLDYVLEIWDIKLEKGNKATDWSPAPEDVQAEIDDAKQEALTAAGNAQNTANSLKDFTDTAFRDGIIDRSESIAIEKYKNSLNETMSKAEASYMKVFLNTYLEGAAKTDLEQAKINLWGQRDTLLSAINTAISGGTTTPAQKTAVDNAFSTFNNLMTAFQNALEEANKAIQAKLDALSTEKVNNIQIGGRNLFSVNDFVADNKARGYSTIEVINYNGNIAYRSSSIINNHDIPHYLQGKFEANTQYYLQFKINWESYTNSGAQYAIMVVYTDGTISNLAATTSQTSRSMLTASGKTIDYITTTRQHDGTVVIYEVQIEKANKPSDWTPAIEDVDKKISDVDAKAQALEYLKQAIGQDAVVDGALYTLVTLLLKEDMNADVTAGVSGERGAGRNAPAFWAGGTYDQAIAGTAKAIIRHDGSSKFSDTEITGVVNATSGKFTGEVIATSGKFTGEINASSGTIGGFKIGSAYIGTGSNWNSGISGMSLWDDFIVFNKPGRQALIGATSSLGFNFLGRFSDTYTDTYSHLYPKTGVIINVTGGSKNNALDVTGDILLNGNMSLKGAIDGLSVRTRQISTTTYLTSEDVYVSCYNSTSITVYLPSSPVIGKVIFIRTINAAAVTINGNGKTINWGTGTGASRGVGDGVGDTVMLVYDGQFWLYNYMIR